jgi:hypothetical protein
MSAKGYGFGASSSSNVSVGLSATITASGGLIKITGNCTDPSGNLYVCGFVYYSSILVRYHFLFKYSLSGTFLWGRSTNTSNSGNYSWESACAYYNGNIYWLTVDDSGNQCIILVPTNGGSSLTVSAYDMNNFFNGSLGGVGISMFVNSSGEIIFGAPCYDLTYTYVGLGRSKLNSNFSVSSYFNVAYPTSINIYPTYAPIIFGADGAIHCSFYNTGSYFGPYLFTMPSSGGGLLEYFNGISSLYSARITDAGGVAYSLVGDSSKVYLIKQSYAGGPIQWQFNTGASNPGTVGTLIIDSNNIYIGAGNGYTSVMSFSQSSGTVNWQKSYQQLYLYTNDQSSLASGNPFFSGNSSGPGSSVTFSVAPKTTGGANGTYAGNVVTTTSYTQTASSIYTSLVGLSSDTWVGSAPTATTKTLGSYGLTINSAVIPA